MSALKCYNRNSLSNCSIAAGRHVTVDGRASKNQDKRIATLLPIRCIPQKRDPCSDGNDCWAESIEFFRRLKENTCISLVVLDMETAQYYPAIRAGWDKKDIILRLSSIADPNQILRANQEVDQYMREMGKPTPQTFHAVYMDEPQKHSIVDLIALPGFKQFVHRYLNTKFVITNYVSWNQDYRYKYRLYADEIIDDGYHDSFAEIAQSRNMGSETFCFSMSEVNSDTNKMLEYIGWANQLGMKQIWLWFGEYNSCDRFWDDLMSFCIAATRSSWASAKEIFIEDRRRYCKFSDCKLCEGAASTDDRYWQDLPLGPIWPERSAPPITPTDFFMKELVFP